MKTQKVTTKLFKSVLAVSILTIAPSILLAQSSDDLLLNSTESSSILQSEQIDVDGQFQARAQEKSPEEIVEEARHKATVNNTKMIAKQIESTQVPRKDVQDITKKEEKNLKDRIANIFSQGEDSDSNNIKDSVTESKSAVVKQEVVVAPVAVAQVEATIAKDSIVDKQIKVIPSMGILKLSGDGIDFESKYSGGVVIESMLSKRVSFGVGIKQAKMDLVDIDNKQFNNYYGMGYDPYIYNYGGGYQYNTYNGYTNVFGNEGREIDYTQTILELNSKLLLSVESRVKPFVGLGLNINRANLKYKDKGSKTYNSPYNVRYGDEEFTSTYLGGSISAGALVSFTSNVGMELEMKYMKGLSGELKTQSLGANEDQARLDRIGNAIQNSSFASLNLGLVIGF